MRIAATTNIMRYGAGVRGSLFPLALPRARVQCQALHDVSSCDQVCILSKDSPTRGSGGRADGFLGLTERSLECYLEKSRGWRFLDDLAVAGNIGPSVLGRVHQLDRDLGLSAGDVPCSEHLALQRGFARCTRRQATLHHEPDGPGLCRVDSFAVEEMSNNDECSSASSEVLRR